MNDEHEWRVVLPVGLILLIAGWIWGWEVMGQVIGLFFLLIMFGAIAVHSIQWVFNNTEEFIGVIGLGLIEGAILFVLFYVLLKILAWVSSGTADWFGWLINYFR